MDVYGSTWGLKLIGGRRKAVDPSFKCYFGVTGQAAFST
jgi:hypothetical protein